MSVRYDDNGGSDARPKFNGLPGEFTSQPRPAFTAAERERHAANLKAATSKISLREAYDAINSHELKALLKPLSVAVAARISAAVLEAAGTRAS